MPHFRQSKPTSAIAAKTMLSTNQIRNVTTIALVFMNGRATQPCCFLAVFVWSGCHQHSIETRALDRDETTPFNYSSLLPEHQYYKTVRQHRRPRFRAFGCIPRRRAVLS